MSIRPLKEQKIREAVDALMEVERKRRDVVELLSRSAIWPKFDHLFMLFRSKERLSDREVFDDATLTRYLADVTKVSLDMQRCLKTLKETKQRIAVNSVFVTQLLYGNNPPLRKFEDTWRRERRRAQSKKYRQKKLAKQRRRMPDAVSDPPKKIFF